MKARENWLDNIKVFACILVALGHFSQSMCTSGILNDGPVYQWFNQTIYYFHVPLFFICSGYLYQKYTVINSLEKWKNHAIKKLLVLGIPYMVFSLLTWVLKSGFSGMVNTEAHGLGYDLFVHPMSPYWYLFALYFIFLITPTFFNRKVCVVVLAFSVLLKIVAGLVDYYAVTIIAGNQVWFVAGMSACMFDFPVIAEKWKHHGVKLAGVFGVLSIIAWYRGVYSELISFLMGLLACTAVMLLFCRPCEKRNGLAVYTMPVFLMHTMFAAGVRVVLLKLGITNSVVHIVLGLLASFICPVIAAEIMKRTKLDFFLYPNKYLRRKSNGVNIMSKKLNGTVIVTYRCNARCNMCNRYKVPSRPEEEISVETIRKLPQMYFTNITGGEPFIREDLKDIVRELYKKSDRIVISTNGFFTDRIIDLCKEFPEIGIRISIEGLERTNNEIRGLEDGYNRGYTTLKKLREMGMKDVGFGMTVQDRNAPDLVPLYKLSDEMGMEFATASLHNSFYFVESKNIIHDRPMVAQNFEALVNELLKSWNPKKWFRAYFNHGLINYIYGQKRLLPCDMSFDTFFIDPYGDVMPCNGTKDKEVMGNLNEQSWDELWNSEAAEQVRKKVRCCDRNCWMIGSVSPAMHKYIWVPGFWVAWHKFKALFMKKPYSMYENKIVRDYRDGKVSKEELDWCSTCEMCSPVNDDLSKAFGEKLREDFVEEVSNR